MSRLFSWLLICATDPRPEPNEKRSKKMKKSKKKKAEEIEAKKNAISSDVHAHKASGYEPRAASYSQIHTPPALSNDYRFIREIGHGAQAKIFLARRLKDGQQVAIKQLNIQSVKSWKAYDLFHREATVLETLNIEGVAKFYDAFECLEDTPPCSYIVQEYIEGRSLAGMLAESHRFKVTDDYDIILQMLAILQRLKQCDPPVIHRDIKPSNIMLTPKQTGGYKVTLLDFGAVANPQVQGGGSTTAGTIGYMPPEQLMGNPVLASDIYSLGVVAIQLFTGIAPGDLQIKDFRLIFEPHMEQMPQELIATLREMLEPNVAERLSDIPVLLERFNGFKNNSFAAKPKKEDLDPGNKMKKMGDQLVKVKSIGDAGNLDLWQALSDQTPRPLPNVCLIFAFQRIKAIIKYSNP